MIRYLPALLAVVLLTTAGLVGCGDNDAGSASADSRELTVYCAAGVKTPVEQAAAAFEQAHPGVKLRIDIGGTGDLLGRMVASRASGQLPDLFVAAEESYADAAVNQGLADRREVIGYFVPVIVVRKDYPGPPIRSLADLARDDVKVVLGDPRGPAVGLVAKNMLTDAGLTGVLDKAANYATVQQIALQVALGSADAGIVWKVIARQGDFPGKMNIVEIDHPPVAKIYLCRIVESRQPELADQFIAFMTTGPGRQAMIDNHYTVEPPGQGPPNPESRQP